MGFIPGEDFDGLPLVIQGVPGGGVLPGGIGLAGPAETGHGGCRPIQDARNLHPCHRQGMEKVAYPSWLANARRVPSVRSVVTKMRSRAPSRPYFSSSSCRKRKKAMADSVVEPDLDTTLTEKSLSCT